MVMADTPVPSRPFGYKYNSPPDRQVRLDVYEDLLCSDTKADRPALMEFLAMEDRDGNVYGDKVEVYFHYFPLPYHHHAHIVTNALTYTFAVTGNHSTTIEFAEWVYDNQETYQGEDSKLMNEFEVIDLLCSEAGGKFGWEAPDCVTNLRDNRDIEMDTRYNWKFAAYNSVSGTPVVLVNGV